MRAVLGLLLAAFAATPAHAQSAQPRVTADYLFHRGNSTLTLSAGGAAFTDFQHERAQTVTGVVASPAYTRRIGAQTTATAGAALAVWLSDRAAMQLSGSFTPTRFRVINEGAAGSNDEAIDTMRYARLDMWIADATLQLRPPLSLGRVYPYAILGGGVLRYSLRKGTEQVPPEASAAFSVSDSQTQLTAVLGAGAMIPLQRKRLLLSFNLTNHLTRTPFRSTIPSSTFPVQGDTLVLLPDDARDDPDGVVLTGNVRLTVGITIPLHLR